MLKLVRAGYGCKVAPVLSVRLYMKYSNEFLKAGRTSLPATQGGGPF